MNSLVQLTTVRGPFPPEKRPELLAPAGDWDCIKAAIENGADAVYFGLDVGFNARARATNFSPDDLPQVMHLLHQRGLKGYVTFNTLIFTNELSSAESCLRKIAAAHVDAVLVQDLGLVHLIRAVCPNLPIHASTQMTLTSAECIRSIESLGVERVVLPRELSVREIDKIHRHTTMPLEAFVHGALCVAYSGQCLTSESLGGRSANRGQCAQACRLPYDLLCDGKEVETADVKYLLSPQDLAAYELIPTLIEAGVCSLKIEGRLKTAEYVANITRHYREAIDSAMAGRPIKFTPRQVEEMELSFSRGFSPGWLEGCEHKRLVPGKSSSKRGVLLGEVKGVGRGRVTVQLRGSVKRGDGVAFDSERPADNEQGGRVYEIFVRGKSIDQPVNSGVVDLAFARDGIDFEQIWPGQQIWKTDDPELTSRLRKSFSNNSPTRRMPVDLTVTAAIGSPLKVEAVVLDDVRISFSSAEPLAEARRHALTAETLREQFGRLGGTAFELRNLDAQISGTPMVPFSVLGQLRHELVQRLETAVVDRPARQIAEASVLDSLRREIVELNSSVRSTPALEENLRSPAMRVLCRTLSQVRSVAEQSARETNVAEILVDFQDIREYREAVQIVHSCGLKISLATPRIQKPDEPGIFHLLAKQGADGILARNLSGLAFFHERKIPVVADFSLNVTNELTAQFLRSRGAVRVTASYDMNRDQLLDLVAVIPPSWLEVVIHQHMPMFHMEHCVFCAMLSPGTNKTNCGRPCDVHEVKLRDRIGMEHPLKADVGCRNTLFNAIPQSAAEVVPTLLERGVRDFRIELLDDPARDIARTLTLYRDLLAGRISGREVWTQLNASNRVGVTRGTLEERRNPLAIL